MWEQKPESKPVCVKSCGRYQPEDQMVYIDYYVMAKINALMKKYTNLEWLGYLVGRDGNIVDDVYLPKQKVSAGSVTDIEVIPEISIIGVIHSHHGLGLHNFSGTDHAYINDNHRLSILVWHEKDGGIGINGQNKITLECGSTMIVPIKIEFFHPELDLTQWVAEADENISTIVYHPQDNAYGRYIDGRYIPYNAYRNTGGFAGPLGSGKYSASEKKSGGKQKNDVREMHSGWQGSASLEECIDLVVGEDDDDLVSETDAILTELRSWRDPSERSDDEIEEHFSRIEASSRCGFDARGDKGGWKTENLPTEPGYLGIHRDEITVFPKDEDENNTNKTALWA